MDHTYFGEGKRIDLSRCKNVSELKDVLDKVFTKNPSYWEKTPLYFDYDRKDFSDIVYEIVKGNINLYQYEYPLKDVSRDSPINEQILFDYCEKISRARSYFLPQVYYNAFLFLERHGLSFHKQDNLTKFMTLKKNKYESIFEVIRENKIKESRDLYSLFGGQQQDRYFEEMDEDITCECGEVGAYRPESDMLYRGADYYMIFPFPKDESTGSMYLFEATN